MAEQRKLQTLRQGYPQPPVLPMPLGCNMSPSVLFSLLLLCPPAKTRLFIRTGFAFVTSIFLCSTFADIVGILVSDVSGADARMHSWVFWCNFIQGTEPSLLTSSLRLSACQDFARFCRDWLTVVRLAWWAASFVEYCPSTRYHIRTAWICLIFYCPAIGTT